MRKCWLICATLFLLCGCVVDEAALAETLYTTLKDQEEIKPVYDVNMNKDYYSYYLPKHIGRIKSNDLSSIFLKDNYKVIMNFDASQIVINEFYNKEQQGADFKELKVTKDDGDSLVFDGSFYNAYNIAHPYSVKIEKLAENQWMMKLKADYTLFYTIVPHAELASVIEDCFVIAKSIRYDSTKILNDFSLKSASEAVKQSLESLNKDVPVDGYLKDLETNQ